MDEIDLSSILKEPPNFGPDTTDFVETFKYNMHEYKSLLCDPEPIEEVINDFKENYKKQFERSLGKIEKLIKIMELSAAQFTFTLTPLISKYDEVSRSNHQLQRIIENTEIDHIFISPIHWVKGHHFDYELYIPIPKRLFELKTPKELLEEHWELIFSENNKEILEIKPRSITTRVYGWNGTWLKYSVSVKDNNNFWTQPLSDTPFNGSQPVVALRTGEFGLLEHDGTVHSKEAADMGLELIKRSTEENRINFATGESIFVAPEWIVAHSMNSNNMGNGNCRKNIEDFGRKLGSASIEKNVTDTEKILDFMKEDLIKRPIYNFDEREIGNCKVVYRD